MKTEVYSWRLSADLKADLQHEARIRKVTVSAILEEAVRDWLKKTGGDATEDGAQGRLHAAAARCLGVLARGNPRRAETARAAVRERLGRRHAR
jgi:predicted transcriptional regulator